MENPRPINRCCYGLTVVLVFILTSEAVVGHDTRPLLWLIEILLLLILVSGAGALLNLAIFPPIFRLLARLTGKQRVQHSIPADDHAR